MPCFGNGKPQKPNRCLVGESPRLPARLIPKWGTVTVVWPEKQASASLTRASPTLAVISTDGVETEIELREWPMPTVRGRQRGIRTRMICAQCGASRDALHFVDGVWCCRGSRGNPCGNLSFASRHRQRYCPAIARRARLLRKLARLPPGSLKVQALREQIAQQESLMLANVKRVTRDLTKRRQRHGRRVDADRRSE